MEVRRNKNNQGFTRRGAVFVALTAVVLLGMFIPALFGAVKHAEALRCATSRHTIEQRYEEYMKYRRSGDTFVDYVRVIADDFDETCPSGGRCVILVSDPDTTLASAHVYCTEHSENFDRIAVPTFTSPNTALEFASQVYELGLLYMAGLEQSYDSVANAGCLPFDRQVSKSLGRTIASSSEFSVSRDGKTQRIEASDEFRLFLDYGSETLSVGKIFFTENAEGAYTNEIDYVAVKQGECWAKYAAYAAECGTGEMRESARPE